MNIKLYDHLPPPPAWQEVFEYCGGIDYFSSRSWYQTFIDTVAKRVGKVVFVAAEDDSGQAVAVLPLWLRRPDSIWHMKRAASLANYYSCLYQPLLSPDRRRAESGLHTIAAHLSAAGRDWSLIDLKPLPAEAWYMQCLSATFASHGFVPQQYVAFGNWYLPAAGMSFDTYFNARSKKMRSTVRSKTNQLQEKYAFDIRIVQEVTEVDGAVRAYNQVYETSWKQSEPFPDFIPALARSLAENSQLRLGLLSLDDHPAAAQLWFVAGRVAHIFKLAYDPEFSQYSVGTILTMKLMEHVLDVDHVEVVDFLSGDDEYKKQWMSHRRERVGLEIVKRKSVAGLVIGARRTAGRLRRRLRSKDQ